MASPECPRCGALREPGVATCATCLFEFEATDASLAAESASAPPWRRLSRGQVAVVAGTAVLAVGTAVLLVVSLLVAGDGSAAGEPSSSASTSDRATPAASLATATPSPSASASAVAPSSAPELGLDSWAEVVVDGLNLRARAGTGAPSLGLLPAGAAGMIAAGPVEADGYTWYAIAGPGIPYQSGCETGPPQVLTCPIWFGWAASSDGQGNPWIEPVQLECPAGPTTIAEVVAIQPGVRLACFGGRTFTLDAYLSPEAGGRGCFSSIYVTPEWLDCEIQFLQGTATQQEAQGPELPAHLHPDLGACYFGGRSPETCPYVPLIGEWIEIEGHFDDAAAVTCAAHVRDGAILDSHPIYVSALDPAHAIYGCREAFVVTSIAPAN